MVYFRSFIISAAAAAAAAAAAEPTKPSMLDVERNWYRISYMWYGVIAVLVALATANIVTLFTFVTGNGNYLNKTVRGLY